MQPPRLDSRTRSDILAQALTLAGRNPPPGWAGYVPAWQPPDGAPDAALRLLQSFARLAEVLIERLNQMPQQHLLAFLDFAGVERFAGAAAEVPVTFLLAKKAALGATVPARTQVATTQTKTTDARVFETRRDFFASRAALERVVVLHPATDRALVLTPPAVPPTAASLSDGAPVALMDGAEPALRDIGHVLHLASEQLFARKDASGFSLTFTIASGELPAELTWQRWDGKAKAWVDLAAPARDVPAAGQLRLTFTPFAPVDKVAVGGVEDYWIAARFTGVLPAVAPPLIVTDLTGTLLPGALPARILDGAFHNATPVDFTKPFAPFGERPAYADAFLLGSALAFSPGNQSVTLTFDIRPYLATALREQFAHAPAMTVTTQGRWEYLDEAGDWRLLANFEHRFVITPVVGSTTGQVTVASSSVTPASGAGEGLFIGASDGDVLTQVVFPSFPSTIGTHRLHKVESRWIRLLLTSERPYGHDGVLVTYPPPAPPAYPIPPRFVGPLFIPPRVESVAVGFVPRPTAIRLDRIRTLDNFTWRDHDPAAPSMRPFGPPSRHELGARLVFGPEPALYCGFDRALERDAYISLFVDLAGPPSSFDAPLESGEPVVAWEYWSASGWRTLDATDETLHLTTSGTVAFVAPADAELVALFPQPEPDGPGDAGPRAWLRARLAAGRYDHPPRLRGVYLNTVMAESRSTFDEVLLGSSNGEPGQTLDVVKGPLLAGAVWVRETERPTVAEVKELEDEHREGDEAAGEPAPLPVIVLVDPADPTGEVWVRWFRVPNLRLSGARSRHYLQDSIASRVRFGDGVRGLIPVAGRDNLVLRGVRVGGGGRHVDAAPLSVKEMKSSLPFVDKVFNVQAATAGAPPWTDAQFVEFGPQAIKTRGRAVTREDHEWMIRQRFSDVARVRCLPVTAPAAGGTLQFRPGAVTALIVPWSTEARPQPSAGLVRQVRRYLASVVLSSIASDVHVKGPDYQAVDVEAVLAPTRPELAIVVARKAQVALDDFLHPLTGGETGAGYGFGRPVFLSEVHAVLERIDEVDHVVTARFVAAPTASVFATDPNRLASSGTHRISVVTGAP